MQIKETKFFQCLVWISMKNENRMARKTTQPINHVNCEKAKEKKEKKQTYKKRTKQKNMQKNMQSCT